MSISDLITKLNNPNLNKEIYPLYLEQLKTMKIDKWIDGNDKQLGEIYNEIHRNIFNYVENKLKI